MISHRFSLLSLSVSIRFCCSNTRRNGPTCSNRLSLSHNSSALWHPQSSLVSTAYDVAHRFPFFPRNSPNQPEQQQTILCVETCVLSDLPCVFFLSFYVLLLLLSIVLCCAQIMRGWRSTSWRRSKRNGQKFTHYTKISGKCDWVSSSDFCAISPATMPCALTRRVRLRA